MPPRSCGESETRTHTHKHEQHDQVTEAPTVYDDTDAHRIICSDFCSHCIALDSFLLLLILSIPQLPPRNQPLLFLLSPHLNIPQPNECPPNQIPPFIKEKPRHTSPPSQPIPPPPQTKHHPSL